MSGGFESPEDAAGKKGLAVVYPAPNQLQIDIDSLDAAHDYDKRIAFVREHLPDLVVEAHRAPSASGLPRLHVTLTLSRSLGALERIAIQSLLGSDPWRELYSFVCHEKGRTLPTCFFEPKNESERGAA